MTNQLFNMLQNYSVLSTLYLNIIKT